MRLALVAFLAAVSLFLLGAFPVDSPGGSSQKNELERGAFVYFDFTTTGLDSDSYDVSKCKTVSYKLDLMGCVGGQGIPRECQAFRNAAGTPSDGGACTIVRIDWNQDGTINASDDAFRLTGSAGFQGAAEVQPRQTRHYWDTTTAPSSGTCRVTIGCH